MTQQTTHLELQALYQISQLIGSALDLDKALSEILGVLHEILRMERATLLLADESGARLRIRASYGLTDEEISRGVYNMNEGVIGKVFRSSYPFVVPDISEEPLFLNRTGARAHLPKGEIAFIGVPVILLDKTVGVLTVDRLFGNEVSFEEDIRFISVVASLIAQFLNLHQALALKEKDLVDENKSLKAELNKRYSYHKIIGQSKVMQEMFKYIDKVAPSRATALLQGESGTGKELVARAIHLESPRTEKSFIKVNCAALPETLLESELFGHEKGAFTGAIAMKKGRFELADGGTLFLDEIGEMPLSLQAKLLRVLQEQQFERLGGTETLYVDVRVIAATNKNLEEEAARGEFRSDLFYRLNVVPVNLPPLRERREDIPLLLDHFLRESNERNNRKVRISKEVLDFLSDYRWPGNVREVQNLIERLVIMVDGDWVMMGDLPVFMAAEPESLLAAGHRDEPMRKSIDDPNRPIIRNPHRSLRDLEKDEVAAALQRHGWVQARAARELGLTQRQIGYRIRKYNLKPPEEFLI